MPAETVLHTSDGPMPAFEARPDGPPRGGVIVLQEAFGLTPHIEDVARRCAAAGWHAVAPALFHREGSPVFAYDDLPSARALLDRLTPAGLAVDVAATIGHLGAGGLAPGRIGVVGFCLGGAVALHAGVEHALGAAVTFYGGGVAAGRFGLPPLVEAAPRLLTPWLGLYGDRDSGIAVEELELLREAAARASVRTAVVRYPEAAHGFHCDDRPAAFDAAVAADAWTRACAWLAANVEQDGGVRIVDAPARRRFEISAAGEPAGFLEYSLRPDGIALNHTEVAVAFGGRGLGGLLTRAALDSARARGLAVLPRCRFIRGWIDKNPAYRDLVAGPR